MAEAERVIHIETYRSRQTPTPKKDSEKPADPINSNRAQAVLYHTGHLLDEVAVAIHGDIDAVQRTPNQIRRRGAKLILGVTALLSTVTAAKVWVAGDHQLPLGNPFGSDNTPEVIGCTYSVPKSDFLFNIAGNLVDGDVSEMMGELREDNPAVFGDNYAEAGTNLIITNPAVCTDEQVAPQVTLKFEQ